MFEKASRLKLRFDTPQGSLTVEELWELPLTSKPGKANLDDIARGLNRLLREAGDDESFVKATAVRGASETNKLRFELVKYVIQVRLAESEALSKAQANRAQKHRILELIAQKQDAALSEKSIEDLTAMVETL